MILYYVFCVSKKESFYDASICTTYIDKDSCNPTCKWFDCGNSPGMCLGKNELVNDMNGKAFTNEELKDQYCGAVNTDKENCESIFTGQECTKSNLDCKWLDCDNSHGKCFQKTNYPTGNTKKICDSNLPTDGSHNNPNKAADTDKHTKASTTKHSQATSSSTNNNNTENGINIYNKPSDGRCKMLKEKGLYVDCTYDKNNNNNIAVKPFIDLDREINSVGDNYSLLVSS